MDPFSIAPRAIRVQMADTLPSGSGAMAGSIINRGDKTWLVRVFKGGTPR
jgi:hypothetical protein